MPDLKTPPEKSEEAEAVVEEAARKVNDPGGAKGKGYTAETTKPSAPEKAPIGVVSDPDVQRCKPD